MLYLLILNFRCQNIFDANNANAAALVAEIFVQDQQIDFSWVRNIKKSNIFINFCEGPGLGRQCNSF